MSYPADAETVRTTPALDHALNRQRAEQEQANNLLNEIVSLDLRLDEAQDELLLGYAHDDIPLVIAAAKRIESLGALMGERCRTFQRSNR